jgi:chromosome segregation protein
MRFKSIEISGFKSFADRTKIYFQPGITSIVGPNGCGKSNVSDALRWVLGEQSAKQIRGERMEDVVFNGTSARAPLGMAEVNLIVTDLDVGVSSEFAAFDEIQITRRYYRSGESEYLINRIPCRLSDIRDLFMDTGMGAKAYAIIGQERIAEILNAKPKERRFLFEEAAGISKYKARKDEALRKLERTRDNLSRVRDIIAEVTRQKNSLNRQAKKAERYKQYKEELREIELHLASLDYGALREQWEELERDYGESKNRDVELTALAAATETRIEDLELVVLDTEKQLNELRDRLRGIEADISKEENRVEVLKGQVSHLNTIVGNADREIERLEEEVSDTEAGTRQMQEEHQRLQEEVAEREAGLRSREAALHTHLLQRAERERDLEAEKGALSDLMRQTGILKNRAENMERERDALREQHDGSDEVRTELSRKLTEAQRLHVEKTESLTDLEATVARHHSEYEGIRGTLEEKQETQAWVLEKLSRLREQIGQDQSRLATLMELQENLEGYDEGIRSLLMRSADRPSPDELPHFHSLVADIFDTDPKYEMAIESALSSRYQSLVVDSAEAALPAVAYLREHKIGRGSFIPLAPKLTERPPFVAREESGVIGHGIDLVRFDQKFREVADLLLGDVIIMEDLEQAVRFYRSNGFRRTLVTLNGEVVDPTGTIEGGARKKNTSGFIRRKREIKELQITLEALKKRLRLAEAERDGMYEEISQIKARLNNSGQALQMLDAKRLHLAEEKTSLHHEIEHTRERIQGLSRDNERRIREMQTLEESLVACGEELRHLETAQEDKRKRLSEAAETLNTFREEIESQRRATTQEHVQIASLREKLTALLARMDANRNKISNLQDLMAARSQEIENAGREIVQVTDEKEKAERRILSLMDTKEEIGTRLTELKEAYETKRMELYSEQRSFKELRTEIEELGRRLHEFEVRRTELTIKKDHIFTRIQEKYLVSLDDIRSTYEHRKIDRPAAEEQLAALNRKIDQMGPVNIMAIEEYNALKERFQFLSTQETDLNESVDSLMAAIRKINRTSRQRFQEAFHAINHQFKKVFTELFQGGQAELRLEVGEDILDAGVEVIAQPPDKKLQHLSLLSGGEKALTAVALIFAGFLVKPSPFCLLDEVDAPLDDANVERYNQMLSWMIRDTQFIVITHNKKTMEFSDALYGITMQEAGISKMVSVRFNDGHESQKTA